MYILGTPKKINDSVEVICTEFSEGIGDYLKESNAFISDYNKAKLVELFNLPKKDFVFPFSLHLKKNKEEKRYLNRSYFEKYSWLMYSNKDYFANLVSFSLIKEENTIVQCYKKFSLHL